MRGTGPGHRPEPSDDPSRGLGLWEERWGPRGVLASLRGGSPGTHGVSSRAGAQTWWPRAGAGRRGARTEAAPCTARATVLFPGHSLRSCEMG